MIDKRCYHCGEADFVLHTFSDMGVHKGVKCPKCGEYAYGSNRLLAVRCFPLEGFDLEALVVALESAA